jgi:opacity protein-like surface antigen
MPRLLAAAALAAALALAAPAHAAAGKPIQLALFPPVQIVPENQSIEGLRLTLLYTKNVNVTGFDFSFIAAHATGNFTGVQWALVGLTDGNFLGWQGGFANITGGTMKGLQWGLYNQAKHVEGLQLGFVNNTGTIHGLQIGLVNIIKQGGWLPVMVIANGNFN